MENEDGGEGRKPGKEPVKTYVCGECGAEFGNKDDLRRHVLTAHPDSQ